MSGPRALFEDVASASRGAHSRSTWFQSVRLDAGGLYLRWSGHFEFLVSADGRRIRYRRLGGASLESLRVYLLGQVLSFSLLARGVEPLHGTVSVIDGRAAAFLGDCGDGKSTLAAALLGRRCPIVTDDLIVLRKRGTAWCVQPGAPRLKLFPEVAAALLDPARPTTPMNGGTRKAVIPLRDAESARRPVPLTAMYVLAAPAPGASGDRIRIEPLSRRDGVLEVVRAAFNVVVGGRDRAASQFAFASRVAADLPVRRLIYPRDLSALPAVCRAVSADLAGACA